MGISAFNTALNRVSKVNSFVGTGSQVYQGLTNPDLAQGASGVLTALAGRSKFARKLLTIDSRVKDIFTKLGGIGDMFKVPTAPIQVWPADPNSIVNQATARLDPQMNFSWTAEIYSTNEEDKFIEPIYIEEISAPVMTLEQHVTFREGMERNYIAGITIASINIKLYEDVTSTAAKFMLSWANAGYSNKLGTFTGSFEYKKSIVISMLDPYGTVSARFILGGCFPTSLLDGYNFTSGAATPISPTATISVDTVECISLNDELIASRAGALSSMAIGMSGAAPAVGGLLSGGISGFKSKLQNSLKSKFSSQLNSLNNLKSNAMNQANGLLASARSGAESAASSALGKAKSFF